MGNFLEQLVLAEILHRRRLQTNGLVRLRFHHGLEQAYCTQRVRRIATQWPLAFGADCFRHRILPALLRAPTLAFVQNDIAWRATSLSLPTEPKAGNRLSLFQKSSQ